MKEFDYIVVGSGCAGLSASLELAVNNRKVLLIEQHNIPGGCATGFVRGRFEFDPSLHELCGVGSEENPGFVREMFDKYGVDIEWNEVTDCFRVISTYSDGTPMDVTMPAGKEAFIDKMEYYVPGSKPSVNKFFDLIQNIEDGLAYISGDEIKVSEIIKRYVPMLRSGGYTTSVVLDALDMPQKAKDILSVYWSYLGVDMEKMSFLHYASMVNSYVKLSAYFPMHTSHEISVKMVERLRELGGTVMMGCRAEKFIFEGDKCVGVETNLGTFKAKFGVLANINPDIVHGKMIPDNLVPKREKKLSAARDRKIGGRMFTAYFGLNKTAEELGIKDYSIFFVGSSDSVKEYNSLKRISTNNYVIMLCYNIHNKGFSPEGTSVVSFTTMFTSSHDFNVLEETEYFKLKNMMAERFINILKDKAGIDISDAIEEVTVASPYTFARYLNAPEGGVYGFETTQWDGVIPRTIEMTMGLDYKIKHLYTIGTSGVRGDGYSSGYADGQILADRALVQFEKEGE
ncbi:MAG: NAD(P)/FAD-dependent oxidoreductase [Clostridiales bacterium]|nr:NAD(P)/FAD-dependent oxidoreductase [Clostridiales bacterium]